MRWLLLIPAVPLLLLAILVGHQLLERRAHDQRLERLELSFAGLSHPAGSRQLATDSRVGLLQGNGNHCDYFVGALRAGAPPIEYPPEAEVLVLDGAASSDWFPLPPRDRLIELGKRQPATPGEVLYVVWFFDQTAPGEDFRCH